MNARGDWDPHARQPSLCLRPKSLIDALYLQFGLSILGNKTYQCCPACGRWFELAPGVGRADKLACSVSCRMKLYRQRQRRARELRAKGWALSKIARELGSDVNTVKNWISQEKEEAP
jgi:hypothetical protein